MLDILAENKLFSLRNHNKRPLTSRQSAMLLNLTRALIIINYCSLVRSADGRDDITTN